MYLGIDLGTSNSAIVGNTGGELRLFKTADGRDVLPSVLYIDRRGHRFVGTKAYDHALLSPQNVARGFKRLMGTKTPLSIAGTSINPEEASAEVLRTLLTQAHAEAGDFDIEGAVITVPAAFNQMQSEATIRAAQSAGLHRVGLLQEPIAAAMASLERASNKDGQFLVYDLGGGTFDVALVQSIKGAVTILAHEGINALGGTDFDKSILNSVIRPWLLEQYDLAEDFQKDPSLQRLIAIARLKGEQAKIELSTHESATIFVSEDEARATDRTGQEIYIEATLTRDLLNRLVEDQISDTIALCRKVLSDNGLSNDDIDRVVLIGGPSKMPAVRDRVPRELGIAVDLNTDPMTAVARGAAIYAEGRVWEGHTSKRKSNMDSKRTAGELQVKFDYEARTTGSEARIKAVVMAGDPTGARVSAKTSDGRETGAQDLATSPVIKVPLEKLGPNPVRVTVVDASGRPILDASPELVITRVVASSAGKPATRTISVKTISGTSGFARNALTALINKGDMLPSSGMQSFRAAKTVRPNTDDRLDIELFQQTEGVMEPDLNLFIGTLRLPADLLDDHQILREGEEVRIYWRMDENELLTASAEVPHLGLHVEDRTIYVDDVGHENFDGEAGQAIVGEMLLSAERDIEQLEEDLGTRAASEIAALRRRLQRQYDDFIACADADGFRKVSEEARHIRQECSRLRHSDPFKKASLTAELNRISGIFEGVADESDTRSSRIEQLTQTTKHALADNRHDEAERAIDELRSVVFSILRDQPGFAVAQFEHVAKARHLALDGNLHDRLVQDGLLAVQTEDMDGLRQVIRQIFANRAIQESASHDLAALAHLTAH